MHVCACRSLATCLKVGVPSPAFAGQPWLVRLLLSTEELHDGKLTTASDVLIVSADGKAGSLVDDSGHFYKPLQVSTLANLGAMVFYADQSSYTGMTVDLHLCLIC